MNPFLQFCIGITVVIVGAFYGYGLYKDRKNESKIDTIKLFKDQIDGMELKMIQQEKDITNLTAQIKLLKDEVEKRDKRLAELLDILQGKDPALKNFIDSFKTDVMPIIKRLERFLESSKF